MKKYILGMILGIVLATSTTALAFVKWDSARKLQEGEVQELRSWIFDNKGLQVFKFQDNGVVCYFAHTSFTGNPTATPVMQCLRL